VSSFDYRGRRVAVYRGLPPGKDPRRVAGCARFGRWSADEVEIFVGKEYPTPEWTSVLAHECVHAALSILGRDSGDEELANAVGDLVAEVLSLPVIAPADPHEEETFLEQERRWFPEDEE